MPQRASRSAVGASVGKMVFHGQSAKRIERQLKSVNQDKLKAALGRRGMATTANKDIAKVLAGESRAGWNQARLRDVVEALQEVGLAKGEKSASEMVLKASRNAQMDANPGLSEGAVKARLKGLARERREEANAEEAGTGQESMSVLDRMRGAMGRANKVQGAQPAAESPDETANATVRKLRETARQDMKLQPKLVIPKPEEKPFDKDTF